MRGERKRAVSEVLIQVYFVVCLPRPSTRYTGGSWDIRQDEEKNKSAKPFIFAGIPCH